jgi:hypothetical protein
MPRSLTVLILEDRPADAELMVDQLNQAGFDARWERVTTREAYMSRLRPELDLILADYNLPRFDAVQALHLLQERDLDVPFIIVTGAIGEPKVLKSLQKGADDYLLKDRLARLGPAVEQALEAKRLREERRSAERETRLSTRQWEATFDAVSEPLLILDVGARIVHANRAMEDFLERPRDRLLGRSCCDVIHGTSHRIDKCPPQLALETLERHTSVWQRDGRWLQATADPIILEKSYLVGFVYILADITARRQAEKALQEKVTQLERINELFVDREHRMLELKREVNALCRKLGRPPRYESPAQADTLRSKRRRLSPSSDHTETKETL